MSGVPPFTLQVYFAGDRLPPEAADLFGHEVEVIWKNVAAAGVELEPGVEGVSDNADDAKALPVCVAATADGQWLAGLFMLLEVDSAPSTGEPQRVASIRHLIIPPAYRGRGLAGRLLRLATSVAAQSKCVRIRSTAGWGCPDHLMIYDRLGFGRADGIDRPYLVSRDLAGHDSAPQS